MNMLNGSDDIENDIESVSVEGGQCDQMPRMCAQYLAM